MSDDRHIRQEMQGISNTNRERTIQVNHVTIRQSIFFLILKLFLLDIVAAGGLILFLSLYVSSTSMIPVNNLFLIFNIPLYIILVSVKMLIMIYISVEWIEDYYEITPTGVIHKQGFLFKKEKHYLHNHIATLTVEQGILGRIFNFGTLKLYDWSSKKDVYLYLIHNPMKYAKVLRDILPDADREKHTLREHIVDEEEI